MSLCGVKYLSYIFFVGTINLCNIYYESMKLFDLLNVQIVAYSNRERG